MLVGNSELVENGLSYEDMKDKSDTFKGSKFYVKQNFKNAEGGISNRIVEIETGFDIQGVIDNAETETLSNGKTWNVIEDLIIRGLHNWCNIENSSSKEQDPHEQFHTDLNQGSICLVNYSEIRKGIVGKTVEAKVADPVSRVARSNFTKAEIKLFGNFQFVNDNKLIPNEVFNPTIEVFVKEFSDTSLLSTPQKELLEELKTGKTNLLVVRGEAEIVKAKNDMVRAKAKTTVKK